MHVSKSAISDDLKKLNVASSFLLLKTDIDSIDAEVLIGVLMVGGFRPAIIYSEVMWDIPPPFEFSQVSDKNGPREKKSGGGCFGMSIQMAQRILSKASYRIVGASHANIIAVREDLFTELKLGNDRPADVWFWYQGVKSAYFHTHWKLGSP